MKKIIKILDWPILFGIGQFLVTIILSLIFLVMEHVNNLDLSYSEIINAENFSTNLSKFLSNHVIWNIIIMVVIFLPILLKKYQVYTNKNNKLNTKDTFLLIILGVNLALILNIIIYNLKITNRYDNINNSKILISIISSGILGPILEELIFRGIVYNRLKEFKGINSSMFIATFIFALFHMEFSQLIYAFLMGYLFVNIYELYGTLKASIISHMSANIIITLFIYNIINLSVVYQFIIYIILSILFVIFLKNSKLYQKKTKI